jgi:hypothetical protein
LAGALLFDEKNPTKCCITLVWIVEGGGLDGFLYEAAQNFEVLLNIQDEIKKTYSG